MALLLDRVIHRLKLRDLLLLQAVVQWRSMAKAAAHLHLTQPAVSKAISELEHTFGVQLLDRGRQGLEPTPYGQALIRRGISMFDELRQGINEIESLSDPEAGEARVAVSVMMAAGILPVIVDQLSRQYPRISVVAQEVSIGLLPFYALPYRELRERAVDLTLGPIVGAAATGDLEIETLFGDTLAVAAGKQNRWVGRRGVALQDLAEERWCLPPLDSAAGLRCVEAFRGNAMDLPKTNVTTMSVHLQIGLLSTQEYLTILPGSLIHFGAARLGIRKLPIKLDVPPQPVGIITLRDRTISSAAQIFVRFAREISRPLHGEQ